MDGIAREGECTGKIMSQRDKPRLALNNITAGVREREDANRTREAGHLDEIQGGVANTLNAFRGRAVGFIDWLNAALGYGGGGWILGVGATFGVGLEGRRVWEWVWCSWV